MTGLLNRILRRLTWLLCRLLPVHKRKIVVSSFYGRGYSDNPKAIVAELLARNCPYRVIWLTRGQAAIDSLPPQVEHCNYDSLRMIYELSTAALWIDNCRKEARYKKRKQLYMQTWHGFALKRIEKDAINTFPPYYEAFAKRDSAFCDVIISDSAFMTQIYRNSFWYEGEIAEFGAPRNDALLAADTHCAQKVRHELGLPENCRTVLYAPTFRADLSLNAYCLDYQRLRQACQQRFGGTWIVLIRLHPNIMQQACQLDFDGQTIFDATAYQDMQELLSTVDMVISDYSSLMFDFALSRRPCFQFAADIEAYKNDRNFYIPLDSLPFPLAVDNAEMEQRILHFENKAYQEKLDAFFAHYGIIQDGQAAVRCVDWLLQHLQEG